MVKTIILGLSASLLLTACTTTQDKVSASHSMASDATSAEMKHHDETVAHFKKVKKRKKRLALKKQKVDLNKFCFKDNHSIHYKVQERCK